MSALSDLWAKWKHLRQPEKTEDPLAQTERGEGLVRLSLSPRSVLQDRAKVQEVR